MTAWADKMIRQNQKLMAEVNQLKKELAEVRYTLHIRELEAAVDLAIIDDSGYFDDAEAKP